jgi:NADP-dependent aldehyde dehydrogenase
LHPGIARAYAEKRSTALTQANVNTLAVAAARPQENQGVPTVASATAEAFFNNPVLHQEVFGPYSLVVQCKNMDQLEKAARHLEGQLTVSLMATDADLSEHVSLLAAAQDIGGRLILNGVPTGVRVALAMQHGGPFPATTDSRFGSVGADGIKRWVRPLCYQGWSDAALPEALKNSNPLGIWRIVNNQLTTEAI